MPSTHPPSLSPASSKGSVDLKANGEVSRMRSHKGNMPSLPQTKQCSLCPARFTRTTHLNRHLRSHTNERLHRCSICQSQFTRSDLLTRHKRTCGDSLNVNRSRRKSCQACAESKIKCDLQLPCSKCAARGRECIFVNDPETSRSKKFAASLRAAAAASNSNQTLQNDTSPAALRHSQLALGSTPFFNDLRTSISVPGFHPPIFSDSSSTTSSSSSRSSPLAEEPRDYLLGSSYDYDTEALTLDTHLGRLFTSNLLEPYVDTDSSPLSYSPQSSLVSEFPWADPVLYTQLHGQPQPHDCEYPEMCSQFNDRQYHKPAAADFTETLRSMSTEGSPSLIRGSSTVLPSLPLSSTLQGSSVSLNFTTPDPTPAELQHYLFLFFTVFSKQIPLIHVATWQMQNKPPILIRAMQACGALFIKTSVALKFVADTVVSTRDIVVQEFAKNSIDSTEHFNMILAVILLQSIGLFHQNSDLRVSSNVYHGMLVMMIRRTRLIARVSAWSPPVFSDVTNLDAAWRNWANYETIKRSLMLAYFHDCANCMYFSLSPSFQPCEFNVCLPSDGLIWNASSAEEWYSLLQSPSPYGIGSGRLLSMKMQKALNFLADPTSKIPPPVLSPFGHFILIHTILRNIHACRSDNVPEASTSNVERSSTDPLATQTALHNWLQSWLQSPESVQLAGEEDEPPFICNSLPFYWLAQVTLLAVQEGTSLLSSTSSNGRKMDGRFRLMKQWLEHIREFLRKGGQIPTDLWAKLMEIRIEVSRKEDADSGMDDSEGLLEFFPGA